ncbi:MAG: hypothetical protein ABR577_13470 [Pyrinomonadaceae bacterium]
MSEEERQRQMDFIIAQQAQFSVNMELMREQVDALREAQVRTDATVAQLAQQVSRTDATVAQLAQQVSHIAIQQAHINEVVAVIADSQQHTDERLNALIDVISESRNGKS